ncbi:MAG TPA: BatD family protein [Candidatus Deferrimicrobium sp.]|nr:BatD family protein [Candidatus Deferrimicrobium sp.]
MMKKKFYFTLLAILAALIISGTLAAQDVEINAEISADKIGADDTLVYTVTLKGINNPTPPDLAGFNDFKIAQTSQSTQFQFINGVSSYSTNFIYYLMPTKTGSLTLPPVSYEFQGKAYKTQTFRVEVVPGSVAPQQQPQQQRRVPSIFDDDDFFNSPFRRSQQPREIDIQLKAELSTRKALKGEPVMFRVLLYSRNSIQSVNMVSNQSFPGFWQEWFPVPQTINSQRGQLDGKTYNIYEIRKAVLFPTQTGSVTIPPIKFELALVDDAFSAFSGSRQIFRSTPEMTVQVTELPPHAIGLPVGDFSFTVIPDKKEVDVNDILTLRVKITARKGNIKTLEIPQFENTDYYKIYPAKISRNTNFNQDTLSGVAEAEIPVSFKKNGLISFPALEFKYFNPGTGTVATHKSSPFSINVVGVKEKQESAGTLPQSEIIKEGTDIDFIKKGTIYNQEDYYYQTGLFKFLLAIFFIFNLGYLLKLFVYDRHIAQHPALVKKKLLNRTINRLHQVRGYEEISPVLEDYLKEKTGLGLSEIHSHTIERLFSKHQVHDSDIKVFIKLKTASELSRFAPQGATGTGTSGGAATGVNVQESGSTLEHDVKQLIEILKRIDGRIK